MFRCGFGSSFCQKYERRFIESTIVVYVVYQFCSCPSISSLLFFFFGDDQQPSNNSQGTCASLSWSMTNNCPSRWSSQVKGSLVHTVVHQQNNTLSTLNSQLSTASQASRQMDSLLCTKHVLDKLPCSSPKLCHHLGSWDTRHIHIQSVRRRTSRKDCIRACSPSLTIVLTSWRILAFFVLLHVLLPASCTWEHASLSLQCALSFVPAPLGFPRVSFVLCCLLSVACRLYSVHQCRTLMFVTL